MNGNIDGPERIRALLGADPRIEEKKMFGGMGFMLNGNMACGFTKKGEMIVRIGKEMEAEARRIPGAETMDFERKMGGMLFVDDSIVADDAALACWVALSLRFVGTLPAKKP